jgi:hypothetical protein
LQKNAIGKTLIDPGKIKRDPSISLFVRYAEYTTTIYGTKLRITAFPFSTKDGETTLCMENTLLNMMDYFSKEYADYHRMLPKDIIAITDEFAFERVLPKKGTDSHITSIALHKFGFETKQYTPEDGWKTPLQVLLCYYLESGIPVAVELLPKGDNPFSIAHSIICIGRSNKGAATPGEIGKIIGDEIGGKLRGKLEFIDTAEFYKFFVVMDDLSPPYAVKDLYDCCIDNIPHKIDSLTVPLYRRIFMDACDAKAIFEKIAEDNTSELSLSKRMNERGISGERIVKRMYLITGRNYKHHLMSCIREKEYESYKQRVALLPFSHFLCICDYFMPEDFMK